MSTRGESRGRIDGIQWLRGLAALGVVLDHAGIMIGRHGAHGDLYLAATGPLRAGVDLFFVISGFVIALPVFTGRAPGQGKFLFARALRIYPMAILTAVLYFAYAGASYPDPFVPGFLASALLLPSPYAKLPNVIWTLKQEVLFYGLFLIVLSDRRRGFAVVLAWCLASLVHALVAPGETNFVLAWLFNVKNLEFGLGILAALAWSRMPARRETAWLLVCASGALFLCATYLLPQSDPVARTLILGCGAAVLIYAIAGVRLPRSDLLLFLGGASYSIYLINEMAIPIVADIVPISAISTLAAFVVAVLGAVAIGAGYHIVFERPLERWRKARQAQWFSRGAEKRAQAGLTVTSAELGL